jgi:hypothetical protein
MKQQQLCFLSAGKEDETRHDISNQGRGALSDVVASQLDTSGTILSAWSEYVCRRMTAGTRFENDYCVQNRL